MLPNGLRLNAFTNLNKFSRNIFFYQLSLSDSIGETFACKSEIFVNNCCCSDCVVVLSFDLSDSVQVLKTARHTAMCLRKKLHSSSFMCLETNKGRRGRGGGIASMCNV